MSGLNNLGANEKGLKKAPQVRILHPPLRSRKFVHHLAAEDDASKSDRSQILDSLLGRVNKKNESISSLVLGIKETLSWSWRVGGVGLSHLA